MINNEVLKNYSLIYSWLKNNGKAIAEKDGKFNEVLMLIEHMPSPEKATESEIYAIVIECRSGEIESFYKDLEQWAEAIRQLYSDCKNTYKQLAEEKSIIIPYLSKFTNIDSEKYETIKRLFHNYSHYFNKYSLQGFVIDGDYKGCGILFENKPLSAIKHKYGIIEILQNYDQYNDISNETLTIADLNHMSQWCKRILKHGDYQLVQVEQYMHFAYFTILLDGKETKLYIEKNY